MGYTRIVPLGGLGEIGMNCLALESQEGVLVIDCGITFPHDELGVDIIHPRFDYLEDRADDLLGVVLTHGHEDHIGALPYLLRRVPVPVWGPPYALALVRERLKEFRDLPETELIPTEPRRRFEVGGYEVEPLRVTHSIPDATALAVRTPGGLVVHTGDFKIEEHPMDGEHFDRARFEALGREGVALLLSDSTNVDRPGRAGEERDVAEKLSALIATKKRRVVVGFFPSNVHRLRTLAQAAAANRRRLCFLGRSVGTHVRAATELRRLGLPHDIVVTPDRARDVPRGELLVVASGTQAEPQSALSRLSRGDHPRLSLESGDAVIFSSRVIPGNERAVWDLICAFERRGMDVHFHGTDPGIHVSGHACREEQTQMIQWTEPDAFVPVHGTFHHLSRHAALARELGVRDVALIENGETLLLDDVGLSEGSRVQVGRVHVDDGVEVDEAVLRERAVMATQGAVMVTVPITVDGRLGGEATIETRGLAPRAPDATVDPRVSVEDAVRGLTESAGRARLDDVREAARRAARRCFGDGQHRPLVVVSLVEV
ncbi:MAG: ribonuclease J [Polyangiales bacterium]